MVGLLKKISGTTLVETLVSMTIISVVSGLAIVIFWQVSAPGSSARSLLLAQEKSAEMMAQAVTEDILLPQDQWTADNLHLDQQVEILDNGLKKIVIEVSDNDQRLIYTRKRLVYARP